MEEKPRWAQVPTTLDWPNRRAKLMRYTLLTLIISGCSAGLPELISLSALQCGNDSDCAVDAFEICAESRCITDPLAVDNDNDQFSEFQGDCDDENPSLNPNAIEICGDDIDQNCDGTDIACSLFDTDGDGFTTESGDCDDNDDSRSPGLAEICDDGIDNDCKLESQEPGDTDGDLDCDFEDGDFDGFTPDEGDCDDADPRTYPFAREICGNTIDEDCDDIEASCDEVDQDGDGFAVLAGGALGLPGGDCDDLDATRNPNAPDICEDGIDQNCKAETGAYNNPVNQDRICSNHVDDDQDGFAEDAGGPLAAVGGDCDDSAPSRNPTAVEQCNLLDDDCDVGIDEDAASCLNYDHAVDPSGVAIVDGSGAAIPQNYTPSPGDRWDIIPFDGTSVVLDGFHFNIQTFSIGSSSPPVQVGNIESAGQGRLRISAVTISIAGTLDGQRAGYGGGGGGGGGPTSGQASSRRGRPGEGIFEGEAGSFPIEDGSGWTGGDGGRGGGNFGGAPGGGGEGEAGCGAPNDGTPGEAGDDGGYRVSGENGDSTVGEEVFVGSGGGGGGGAGGSSSATACSPASNERSGSGGGAGGIGGGAVSLIAGDSISITGHITMSGTADGGDGGESETDNSGGFGGDGGDASDTGNGLGNSAANSGGDGGVGSGGGIMLRSLGTISLSGSALRSTGGGQSCTTNTFNSSTPGGSVKIFASETNITSLQNNVCAARLCGGLPFTTCVDVP